MTEAEMTTFFIAEGIPPEVVLHIFAPPSPDMVLVCDGRCGSIDPDTEGYCVACPNEVKSEK